MKCLQTNIGRSRAAHDIAYAVAKEKNIDIIIISEPNINIAKSQNLITDNRMDVAILILNRNIGVNRVEKGEGYVKIEFDTWILYGCYISPNIPLMEFKQYIDKVMTNIRDSKKEKIFAGDLNAKSNAWGSPYTDARGKYVDEWVAELDLVIMNRGNTPTFERGNSRSFIDVTGATANVAKKIKGWEVLLGEFLTLHNHIYFEICQSVSIRPSSTRKALFDGEKFGEVLRRKISYPENKTFEDLEKAIKEATAECTTVIRSEQRRIPYWWNIDIENLRKECLRYRRAITRLNSRNDTVQNDLGNLQEEYKQACKKLKKSIKRSKREHWKKLCDDLENDIWGSGYKIAIKSIGKQTLPFNLSEQQKETIVASLFPQRNDPWLKGPKVSGGIPPITREELDSAAAQIKINKAPGPDRLTPEAVKMLVKTIPDVLLEILNQILINQEFPKTWKEASIVLIWKGKPPELPSSFRPICMLSMLGKFFERILKGRIEEEVERSGNLSEKQFGFRKGRSTIHAIETVVRAAKNCKKKWFVAVALDIKNAFNTATWSKIIRELQAKGVPRYLINTVESYFEDRVIKITKNKTFDMKAGVPQGSVLGPILWNIFYDQVLKVSLPEGATALAYADDLLVMVEAINDIEIERRVNESLNRINRWMTRNDLEMAHEKTEAIILKGARRRENLNFVINGKRIVPVKHMRYLGVTLDENLSFAEHVKRVTKKADTKMAVLTRILPNVGGPSSLKRAVLCEVIHSIVLYAAPVWHEVVGIKKYENMLLSTQRKALLRIASGYRTTSTPAIQVITGIPPISLQIKERHRLHLRGDSLLEPVKHEERETTLDMWQQQWESTDKATWTRILIQDIRPWLKCRHRILDFYLTQFLTGHGSFRHYTKRMNITQDDLCAYCGIEDTAEHTVLICDRWDVWRKDLEKSVKGNMSRNTIVFKMLENSENWTAVRNFVKKILIQKKQEERELAETGTMVWTREA